MRFYYARFTKAGGEETEKNAPNGRNTDFEIVSGLGNGLNILIMLIKLSRITLEMVVFIYFAPQTCTRLHSILKLTSDLESASSKTLILIPMTIYYHHLAFYPPTPPLLPSPFNNNLNSIAFFESEKLVS